MALTATANQQVRDDVINQLGIQGCLLLQQSFNRPNLNYEVRPKKGKIVSEIAAWIMENHAGHTGVIYARTKIQCEKVAEELREHYKLSAEYYHADLDPTLKNKRLKDWLNGTTKIVVATVSFLTCFLCAVAESHTDSIWYGS
jgi:superfamily II DNA helicase RecQ